VTTTQVKNNLVGTTAAPTAVSATDNATAGTLTATTYYWKITATGPFGESIASAEFSLLATVNHSANIIFTPPAGATGYRLYRGPTGAEDHLIMSGACVGGVSNTVIDSGAAGVAATPPATAALVTVPKTVQLPTKANLPALTSWPPGTGQPLQNALYQALSEWLCDCASATSVPTTTAVALLAKKRAAACGFLLQET
jgi:hypothetical protein